MSFALKLRPFGAEGARAQRAGPGLWVPALPHTAQRKVLSLGLRLLISNTGLPNTRPLTWGACCEAQSFGKKNREH